MRKEGQMSNSAQCAMNCSTAEAAPAAVLIFTPSSKLLVSCAVGAYAQRPVFEPLPLCQLLSTMQGVAGHPQSGYVELHGMSVLLLEGDSMIVAVLCGRAASRSALGAARLLGLQVLNTFGKLHHDRLGALDTQHEQALNAAVTSYTFHSATSSHPSDGSGIAAGEGSSATTLPEFVEFERSYVLPLLLRPPADVLWLQPLMNLGATICAMLLRPPLSPPATSEDGVLLATAPRACISGGLECSVGAHVPQLWNGVMTEALSLTRLASKAAHGPGSGARGGGSGSGGAGPSASPNTARMRLGVLAFPELRDAGGECVHVVMRAVRITPILPEGACFAVFFSAVAPGAEPDASGAVRRMEGALPAGLHDALEQAAHMVESAFPAAVSSLADAISALTSGAPPMTPTSSSSSSSSSFSLEILTPR
jgi:hypothetical protein